MENIKKKILKIEKLIPNPSHSLPKDIFYFIGRVTPYINVDLLIRCPEKGTLLTWRQDNITGFGWHIPGGIIRFRENIKKRIQEVAKSELGIRISNYKGPIEINEIISNLKERSHFISLLYSCYLSKNQKSKLEKILKKNPNIKFFKSVPKNLLKWHKIYKNYI